MSLLWEMLSYPFLLRAFVVGTLVSLCAALLGTSLVLKRFSMLGDGLSHVGFASLAIATALGAAPLAVAIPVCVAAAFFLLRLGRGARIGGDAATALLCSGALAVGVCTISLTTGMNVDVCNYMFGSILSMTIADERLSIALCLLVLLLYVLFRHKIFAVTFDETFARATGLQVERCNMLLSLLTAVTVVLGMRMMGTLLISSLLVFPALTAMRLCRRFDAVLLCAAAVSVVCFWAGLTVSYLYSTPSGASIVLTNLLAFGIFSLIARLKEK